MLTHTLTEQQADALAAGATLIVIPVEPQPTQESLVDLAPGHVCFHTFDIDLEFEEEYHCPLGAPGDVVGFVVCLDGIGDRCLDRVGGRLDSCWHCPDAHKIGRRRVTSVEVKRVREMTEEEEQAARYTEASSPRTAWPHLWAWFVGLEESNG